MIRALPGAGRLAALVGLLLAAPAGAQELRTVEFARQLRDTLPMDVRVDYTAGKVVLHGMEQPLLYQAQIAYDPRRSEPVYEYDAAARRLRIGARRPDGEGAARGDAPELRLDLARVVPVSLSLQMGAAEADLDLGGMRLTRLSVESGASDALLHFDAPNLVPMERLDLDVGAASLRARGLANARARDMNVKVGIGTAELDFGGEWAADVELDLEVSLGKATLRVPADVGVRVETSRVLASFQREGFVKRGDAYYSDNWDRATRRLHVRSRIVLGQLELQRGAN
jgi:hypothetical protein